MKYKIDKHDGNVNISVTEIEGKSQEILNVFQDCQAGSCSCKSTEYEKVDSFEIKTNESDVQLIIKSKNNESIDSSGIEKCLEYAKSNLSK